MTCSSPEGIPIQRDDVNTTVEKKTKTKDELRGERIMEEIEALVREIVHNYLQDKKR